MRQIWLPLGCVGGGRPHPEQGNPKLPPPAGRAEIQWQSPCPCPSAQLWSHGYPRGAGEPRGLPPLWFPPISKGTRRSHGCPVTPFLLGGQQGCGATRGPELMLGQEEGFRAGLVPSRKAMEGRRWWCPHHNLAALLRPRVGDPIKQNHPG